jgi:divalent metal cation (Fe/Co/Zn/Cd) transporter
VSGIFAGSGRLLCVGSAVVDLGREHDHYVMLFADAQMNKADWLTAVAAMVGVMGIGFGIWRLPGSLPARRCR